VSVLETYFRTVMMISYVIVMYSSIKFIV